MKRVWEGLIEDMPEQYKNNRKIPEDCVGVIIYDNGCRTYHKGLKLDEKTRLSISKALSRCWDSLPLEKKIEINKMVT